MHRYLRQILVLVLVCAGWTFVHAQASSVMATLDVSGRVKIGAKQELIKRKRFYLIRGGLDTNKALVEILKKQEAVSMECFYCKINASPAYINWLKVQGCESPYCREVSDADIVAVPEFQAAYQKGLKQYRKDETARMWLTTNLLPDLRDGFYRQQKMLTATMLGTIKPEQSSMTDSVSVKAAFIDIPISVDGTGKSTDKFLISNIVPIEINGKSYVWACEVAAKNKMTVQLPEKTTKACEVMSKDLPPCNVGSCVQK